MKAHAFSVVFLFFHKKKEKGKMETVFYWQKSYREMTISVVVAIVRSLAFSHFNHSLPFFASIQHNFQKQRSTGNWKKAKSCFKKAFVIKQTFIIVVDCRLYNFESNIVLDFYLFGTFFSFFLPQNFPPIPRLFLNFFSITFLDFLQLNRF